MSSNVNIGIGNDGKMSSRVLKPPGGGSSNIFAPPEEKVRPPRPKNDQQNSSMMSEIMGKKPESALAPKAALEPVALAEPPKPAPESAYTAPAEPSKSEPVRQADPAPAPFSTSRTTEEKPQTRGRVPPGGFSSGLW